MYLLLTNAQNSYLISKSYLCAMLVKSDKIDVRSLSLEELKKLFTDKGEAVFRAKQVYEWLWKKGVRSFDEMSNLTLDMRDWLKENFEINTVAVGDFQVSKDRTIKNAFRLYDGNIVEGVLIPSTTRMTACISSQVGCSLTCKFCATGKLERLRNLNADEIYDQVVLIRNQSLSHYNIPLTNIVYMGMGEPLLNYKNVLDSVEKITSVEGLNMSPQRITISTAGIAKMIKKLGDDNVKFNLAVSLHAPDDVTRAKLLPMGKRFPIADILAAADRFQASRGRPVTIQYCLLAGVNDSPEHARMLAALLAARRMHVNLLRYNPTGLSLQGVNYEPSSDETAEAFAAVLRSQKVVAHFRRSRGKDIDAACGQLRRRDQDTPRVALS